MVDIYILESIEDAPAGPADPGGHHHRHMIGLGITDRIVYLNHMCLF